MGFIGKIIDDKLELERNISNLLNNFCSRHFLSIDDLKLNRIEAQRTFENKNFLDEVEKSLLACGGLYSVHVYTNKYFSRANDYIDLMNVAKYERKNEETIDFLKKQLTPFMNIPLAAIQESKFIALPDSEEIFEFTDYDKQRWEKAFEWFNTYMEYKADTTKPEHYTMVYKALRTAKQFTQ